MRIGATGTVQVRYTLLARVLGSGNPSRHTGWLSLKRGLKVGWGGTWVLDAVLYAPPPPRVNFHQSEQILLIDMLGKYKEVPYPP